uniref:Uncharacterized protein n=1 Tax=Caenorhabditis japonica TaxID=281687 RepID=A0A8R1DHM2_CAEJA
MKLQLMLVVMLTVIQLATTATTYFPGIPRLAERSLKRALPQEPDWNQLGWAWGKRSADNNDEALPRRLIRALHAVKKNPDWQDLGFAWGRRK